MEIVSGLDLHRSQITFRTVDLRSGDVARGKRAHGRILACTILNI